jgi:hypothetical protein
VAECITNLDWQVLKLETYQAMVTAKWGDITTPSGAAEPWQAEGTREPPFQQYSSQVASSQATAQFTTSGTVDGGAIDSSHPDGTQEQFFQQHSPQPAAQTTAQEAPFQHNSSQTGSSQAAGSISATPRVEKPTNKWEEWQTSQPQPSRSKLHGRQNTSQLARTSRMPGAAAPERLSAFPAPAERVAAQKAKRSIAASVESDAIGRRREKAMHRSGKSRRL